MYSTQQLCPHIWLFPVLDGSEKKTQEYVSDCTNRTEEPDQGLRSTVGKSRSQFCSPAGPETGFERCLEAVQGLTHARTCSSVVLISPTIS